MIDNELLKMLRCPETQSTLEVASAEQLAALNAQIKKGTVKTADGRAVADPVEEGLVTSDGSRLYRIDDGIPVMLVDESILMTGLG